MKRKLQLRFDSKFALHSLFIALLAASITWGSEVIASSQQIGKSSSQEEQIVAKLVHDIGDVRNK